MIVNSKLLPFTHDFRIVVSFVVSFVAFKHDNERCLVGHLPFINACVLFVIFSFVTFCLQFFHLFVPCFIVFSLIMFILICCNVIVNLSICSAFINSWYCLFIHCICFFLHNNAFINLV